MRQDDESQNESHAGNESQHHLMERGCFSVFETRCHASQIAAGSADEGGPCNLSDFKSGFQFAIETLP
jgi:hypothetical protein